MGTDIHVICQVKENGKWINNPVKIFKHTFLKETEMKTFPDDSRSYDWFSIIANVRNGYGFAGVKTGSGFAFISEPRGKPEDFETPYEEYEGELEPIYLGDHSFSYITLNELRNFDWNQVTTKSGVISIEQYAKIRGTANCPDGWSGRIAGPRIVVLNEEEADNIIDGKATGLPRIADPEYYVQYHWPVLYSEWFKDKIESWINQAATLLDIYEDVRFVFGFDS